MQPIWGERSRACDTGSSPRSVRISKPSVSTLGRGSHNDPESRHGTAYEPRRVRCITVTCPERRNKLDVMSHTHAWVLVHIACSARRSAPTSSPILTNCVVIITGVAHANKHDAARSRRNLQLRASPDCLVPSFRCARKAVQDLKGNSSRWLGERGVRFALAGRLWRIWRQPIAEAIQSPTTSRRQEEHHRKWSFEQEFMTLLRKSGCSLRSHGMFSDETYAVPAGLGLTTREDPALKRWA